MIKPVVLACVTYRRFDLLARMIESAERGVRAPDKYLLLSNGGNLEHCLRAGIVALPESARGKTEAHDLGRVSVASAWNKAFREHRDHHVVVTGDDVVFGRGTIGGLVDAADKTEALFVYPRVMQAQMFCVYLAKAELFDRVGPFDERFFPAYFEDNDLAYRMKLAGLEAEAVDCDGYLHDVSSTLKALNPPEREEHDTQFRMNEKRYVDKWGGLPGREVYDKPMA